MNNDKPLLVDTGRGLTIKYRNRLLYSKFAPTDRANKIAISNNLNDSTIYIVPSPLLCYGLDKLKLPETSIILLVEIDENLFNISDKTSPILFIKKGIDFLDILKKIDFDRYKKCELLILNGGFNLYRKEYDRLLNILLNYMHSYWKNRYTITKMGQLWIKNTIKNLPLLDSAQPFDRLKTDKPIIVVGAGESAENSLNKLKDIRDRIFILCVDTALQTLLEVDIVPDVVLALEAQYYNLPDFYGAKNKNINLIFDLSSYPGVIRTLNGKKYYAITKFSDSKILSKVEKLAPNLQMLPPLGSVGITAIYIALKLTTNSIFLVGLDFSYTLGKTHSKGTPYHLTSLQKWNRLNPGNSYESSLNRPIKNYKNKFGELENSDSILYEYSLHAKELLSDTRDIYDISTKGMNLGVPIIKIDDIEKYFITTNLINNKIKEKTYNNKIFKNLNQSEISALNSAIDSIKKYLLNSDNMDIKDIINELKNIEYFFDFYPENTPLKKFTLANLPRFYATLLRYRRIIN